MTTNHWTGAVKTVLTTAALASMLVEAITAGKGNQNGHCGATIGPFHQLPAIIPSDTHKECDLIGTTAKRVHESHLYVDG
jgi:hypothetical protein